LLLFTGVALAHALLVKSEPGNGAILAQPPAQVKAWFGQELDADFSTLQVFDAAGRQVDLGDGGVDLYDPDHASLVVSLPAALPNGPYRVRWSVVSVEDGDPTEGEFSFTVGQDDAGGGQTSAVTTAQTQPLRDLPLAWIAAGLGVVILATLGLARRYFRSRPRVK
jgi:methionine-rich copper-binding protein CopC